MRRRHVLGLAGLALFVGAVLTAGVDGEGGPAATLVDVLGNDYLVVALLGVPAVVLAAALFAAGRPGTFHRASLPEPERPARAPIAGAGFDERLDTWRAWLPFSDRQWRRDAHHRLRQATIRSIQRVECCPHDRAEQRVDAGTWTDDESVAGFLAPAEVPRPPVVVEVASLLRGDPWFRRRVRETVDELVAYDRRARSGQFTTEGAKTG